MAEISGHLYHTEASSHKRVSCLVYKRSPFPHVAVIEYSLQIENNGAFADYTMNNAWKQVNELLPSCEFQQKEFRRRLQILAILHSLLYPQVFYSDA